MFTGECEGRDGFSALALLLMMGKRRAVQCGRRVTGHILLSHIGGPCESGSSAGRSWERFVLSSRLSRVTSRTLVVMNESHDNAAANKTSISHARLSRCETALRLAAFTTEPRRRRLQLSCGPGTDHPRSGLSLIVFRRCTSRAMTEALSPVEMDSQSGKSPSVASSARY